MNDKDRQQPAPVEARDDLDAEGIGRVAQDAWMDSHATYPAWGYLTRDEQAAWVAVGERIKRAVAALAQPVAAPEVTAEDYIAAEIDRAPEPLRRLGDYLAQVLDEDEAKTAHRMVLGAIEAANKAVAAPAPQEADAEHLLDVLRAMRSASTQCYNFANRIEAALIAAAQPPAPVTPTAGEAVPMPRDPPPEMLAHFWHVCAGHDWMSAPMPLTKRQLARARRAYFAMVAHARAYLAASTQGPSNDPR